MEIAIVVVVLLIIGLVIFFVMRSGSGMAGRSLLDAASLRAKFGTTATTPEASTP